MPARRRTREARVERLERHAAETDPQVVMAAALRLIEAAPRSVTDVRTRLLRACWPEALVAGTIARLTDLGLLDDEAFARALLESRDRARPRGERALKAELRRKGVASEVADMALDERRGAAPANASADELAAERLLARRRSALERVDGDRARRRWAYALLARNGFDPDVAARVAGRVGSMDTGQEP